MAKSSSGESKAPLVIALVFFVLTTLGLGVLYYMKTDEMKTVQASAKTATDESAKYKKEISQANERLLVYKVAMGVNTQEEFETLKNALNESDVRATHAALLEAVKTKVNGTPQAPGLVTVEAKNFVGTNARFDMTPDQILKWPWPEGAKLEKEPERPLLASVVYSYARQQLAGLRQAANDQANAELKKTLETQQAQAKAAQGAFQTAAAEFPKREADTKAKADEAVKKEADAFNAKIATHNKKATDLAEQNQQKDIIIQDKDQKITGLSGQVKRAEDAKAATEDPFSYDKPHGRIIYKHRGSNLVDINLGSADNVRTGLTFTVQPQDTPTRGLQSRARPRLNPAGQPVFDNDRPVIDIYPKGTIEVVDVLGPNLSTARVTSNPDPVRDALIVGDVLYNAAWRKGGADHVALFGVFDVNADGTDDIKQVIRELSNMGVVVDAYYDLETKKWVGKLTELTAYAVEGYYPVISVGSDALATAKGALDQALKDAKNQAKDKGVAVVKARTFFSRIGYNMKTDITTEAINRAYSRYLQAAPTEGGDPK